VGQRSGGVTDRHVRLPVVPVETHGQGQRERRRALEERVLRSLERRLDTIAFERDMTPQAAFLKCVTGGSRREEQERALSAEKIRHAHRAQLGAIETVGRKRDRDSENRAPDPMLPENRPERFGLAQQAELGRPQRNAVASDPQHLVDFSDACRGQEWEVGAPIAIEEIEDVVAGRMRAGAERRPGHRRDRGIRSLQPRVTSALGEGAEVGQDAFLHELVGELRILAIEPDDDESGDRRFGRRLLCHGPPQRAKWPGEQREQHGDKGRDQHERRRHQREARARADVC
jgi:hypothetical protein